MLVIFAICLLLAVCAVTDIAAGYLRRQAVSSLADGAAIAVSDAASASSVYLHRHERYVVIGERAAQAAVTRYLRRAGAYRTYPSLFARVTVDGHVVRVDLQTTYRLPVHLPGAGATTVIHASASSEMPIY